MMPPKVVVHDETLSGGDVLAVHNGGGGSVAGDDLKRLSVKSQVNVAGSLVGAGTDNEDVAGVAGVQSRLNGLFRLVERVSGIGIGTIGVRDVENVGLQVERDAKPCSGKESQEKTLRKSRQFCFHGVNCWKKKQKGESCPKVQVV